MAVMRGCTLAITAVTAYVASAGRSVKQKRVTQLDNSEAISLGITDETQRLWKEYTLPVYERANEVAGGLQSRGCLPMLYGPSRTYRGSIMLHHGFTACPQQYDTLVRRLTAKGYAVFMPVLPGHGYLPEKNRITGELQDHIEDMPMEPEVYFEFAEQMHRVMMSVTGEKVLMGLSLGGGVASYQGFMGGYDRRLYAVPLLSSAGFWGDLLNEFLNDPLSFVGKWRVGWGEGCATERSQGRQGNCEFSPSILSAANNVGGKHYSMAKKENRTEKNVQIMFVEDDPVVGVDKTVDLARFYGMDESSPMVCGMDSAVGHSFLSRWDNPNQNKYWREETEAMIAAWLTDGVAIPQGGDPKSGWPRCNVQCTPTTC